MVKVEECRNWDKDTLSQFASMTQEYLERHTFMRLRSMIPKIIAFFFLSRMENQDVLFSRIEKEFRQMSRQLTRRYAYEQTLILHGLSIGGASSTGSGGDYS